MRIALGLSYEGTAYSGWQSQENLQTIQTHIETALSRVANHPVQVICAGRTDSGVHALGQVIHFDTEATRDERAWILGTNANLPADIRIRWAHAVSEDFHARFSATARHYRYIIYNYPIRPALLRNQVTTYYYPLDASKMQAAAQYLIGEHDFSSYRATECQAKSPIRNVTLLEVKRQDDFIFIDIEANAFLHHMVRNIAGVLMAIGSGKQPPIWAQQVLAAKDRTQGDITAPASGLYFVSANYPEYYGLALKNLPEPAFTVSKK